MIYLVIYHNAERPVAIPVQLQQLSQDDQEKAKPFLGKVVTFDHGEFREYNERR
jgi:hypothetical protein